MDLSQTPRQVFEETLKKILFWGMILNLGVPTGLLIIAYWLTAAGATLHLSPQSLNLIFLVFLVVSLGDLGAAAVLRFFLLSSARLAVQAEAKKVSVSAILFNTTMVIYALCLFSAVLGFFYFLFGGQIERGLLLLVFNLLGYQFLRPRPGLVKKLLGYTSI
jgi:hypothetical protein